MTSISVGQSVKIYGLKSGIDKKGRKWNMFVSSLAKFNSQIKLYETICYVTFFTYSDIELKENDLIIIDKILNVTAQSKEINGITKISLTLNVEVKNNIEAINEGEKKSLSINNFDVSAKDLY